MEKGFNREGFLNWLKEEFSGCLGNEWDCQLVNNILDYARDHEHISKNQICDYLSDILPDVDFWDVAMFCEDKILTDHVIEALALMNKPRKLGVMK